MLNTDSETNNRDTKMEKKSQADTAAAQPDKSQNNADISSYEHPRTKAPKSNFNDTKGDGEPQAEAPIDKAVKDSRRKAGGDWAEKFGRALASDRSCDHVGLPYFEGYPWENKDTQANESKQLGQENVKKDGEQDSKEHESIECDEDENTDPFNERVPPW